MVGVFQLTSPTSVEPPASGASGVGQTVLAKACDAAKINFEGAKAHSALYDTEKTAELFCHIVNRWKKLGGWPLGD